MTSPVVRCSWRAERARWPWGSGGALAVDASAGGRRHGGHLLHADLRDRRGPLLHRRRQDPAGRHRGPGGDPPRPAAQGDRRGDVPAAEGQRPWTSGTATRWASTPGTRRPAAAGGGGGGPAPGGTPTGTPAGTPTGAPPSGGPGGGRAATRSPPTTAAICAAPGAPTGAGTSPSGPSSPAGTRAAVCTSTSRCVGGAWTDAGYEGGRTATPGSCSSPSRRCC